MFLRELILIKQALQKIFATIGVFWKKEFKFQPYVYNRYHDVLIMSINLKDITILNNSGHWLSLFY